jgi:ribosomal protein L2
MADNLDWVGGLMGTMIVGGVLMNMSNSMFGGNSRRRGTTTTTTTRRGRKGTRTTVRKVTRYPSNFSNILWRY